MQTITAMAFAVGLLCVAAAFLCGAPQAPRVSTIVALIGVIGTFLTVIVNPVDRTSNLIALAVFVLLAAYSVRVARAWRIRFGPRRRHGAVT